MTNIAQQGLCLPQTNIRYRHRDCARTDTGTRHTASTKAFSGRYTGQWFPEQAAQAANRPSTPRSFFHAFNARTARQAQVRRSISSFLSSTDCPCRRLDFDWASCPAARRLAHVTSRVSSYAYSSAYYRLAYVRTLSAVSARPVRPYRSARVVRSLYLRPRVLGRTSFSGVAFMI